MRRAGARAGLAIMAACLPLTATAADYAAALSAANAKIAAGASDYVAVKVGADVIVFADSHHNNGTADAAVVLVGKSLSDIWNTAADNGRYDLFVLAPNGFRRDFVGDATGTQAEIDVRIQPRTQKLQLTARNTGSVPATLKLEHNAYGGTAEDLAVAAGGLEDVRETHRRPDRHDRRRVRHLGGHLRDHCGPPCLSREQRQRAEQEHQAHVQPPRDQDHNRDEIEQDEPDVNIHVRISARFRGSRPGDDLAGRTVPAQARTAVASRLSADCVVRATLPRARRRMGTGRRCRR